MAHSGDGRWLSLGRACEILGVNETTLRQWANTGRIRTFRTPGGHRRFSREDLNALTQLAPKAGNGAFSNGDGPSPLERIRRRMGRRKAQDHWLQYFDDEGRTRMRVLGRRLVTLTSEYMNRRRRRRAELQEEARHLGIDYGRELSSRNVGLADAVSAFIFFRNFLHGAMDQGSENGEKGTVVLSILEVEDLVLLGMASVYENSVLATSPPINGALTAERVH